MKKAVNAALMAAMMMSTAYDNRHFMTDPEYGERMRRRREAQLKERAQRAVAQYQSQQHEFVVHGEKIVANNRKTALKIYEKRHPELKRKKM